MKRLILIAILSFLIYPSAALCGTRYQDECITDMVWVETRGATQTDHWFSIRTVLNRIRYPKDFGGTPCDVIRHHVTSKGKVRYEFQWARHMPKIPRSHPLYRKMFHLVSVVRQTAPKGCEKDILFFRRPGFHTGVKGAHLCAVGKMYYFAKNMKGSTHS